MADAYDAIAAKYSGAPADPYDAIAAKFGGAEPQASLGDRFARQAGLTARYGVEGALGLANVFADPINKLLGMQPASTGVSNALTALGLPEPQGATERVVGDVSRALAGTGALAKGASSLAAKTPGTLGDILNAVSAAPGTQAIGALGAGAFGGLARENGAGPLGQFAASVAGGVLAPASVDTLGQLAGGAYRFGRAAIAPFYEGGREQIIGNTLNRFASDPVQAKANISSPPQYVEGSAPTTAQASRDIGLAQLERTVANASPEIAARLADNNVARVSALRGMAGDENDLSAAIRDRSSNANADYAAANAEPVKFTGDTARAMIDIGKTPAFLQAQKEATTLALNSGMNTSDISLNNPQFLHFIKMAMDDQISTGPQNGMGRSQMRAIVGVQQKFLDVLDQVNPAYANARQNFAAASEPINQMETLQNIQRQTRLAGPDTQGNPVLSQAKWQNVVGKNIAELGKTLSPDQMSTLRSIGQDLDLGTVSQAGKALGSNSIQNLSSANILGQTLGNRAAGSPLLQTLTRPLQWLYKIPQTDVEELLTKAMLDPLAANLMMSKATPNNLEGLSSVLKNRYTSMLQGAMVGNATAGGTQP